MIIVNISAEGADPAVLDALLERASDEVLVWAAIKRQHVQVRCLPIQVPAQPEQSQVLDGMVLK